MLRSTIVVVAGWVGGMLLSSCYRPDLGRCAVLCQDGETCPDGWTCGADLHCHTADDGELCSSETPDAPPPRGYAAISAGGSHACAIDVDGELYCWGLATSAQLGVEVDRRTGTPTDVGGPGWTHISAGEQHTCGIRDGAMLCWGRDDYGQAGGIPTPDVPTELASGFTDWIALDAGSAFTCGIRGTAGAGRLYCWGDDANHQLGDGAGDQSGPTPREVGTTDGVDRFDDFVEVSAGGIHACALRASGALYCFGSGGNGRLGNNGTVDSDVPVPVDGGPYAHVAVGGQFSCAVTEPDGELWCWGNNASGELAHTPGNPAEAHAPLRVGTLDGWTAIGAGGFSACAAHGAGAVSCWGAGENGEIGNGDYEPAYEPTEVQDLAGASALTGGFQFACALVDGHASCWGNDNDGQLGNGSWAIKREPSRVGDANDWVTVVAGRDHTCGIRAGGALYCWGSNRHLRLGSSVTPTSPTPLEVTAADAWLEVSLGQYHTCATRQGTDETELWCWGNDDDNQLGNGAITGEHLPARIAPLATGWDHLAASVHGNCAMSGGQRYCWGFPGSGVLGNGSATATVAVPTAVTGETLAWTRFSFGLTFGCGITDSDIYCWGANDAGQQGRGDDTGGPFLTPTMTATGLMTDVSAAWGDSSACAIAGGALRCWGDNGYGRVGIDSAAPEIHLPTEVTSTVTDWIQVSAGLTHTCAIATGNELHCWGNNIDGQLGDETVPNVGVPTRIDPFRSWRQVSAGYLHTCAITTDNELYCWGRNLYGVLGDGSQNWSFPQPVL
jgi:alpha-tubulin suppressor-like RCC1 family protein